MRIISGRFGSRRLKGDPPPGIRPTSDKLRETLFNILGPGVDGAVFLDAYAGMGGIGIEAISRGASMVYFVDKTRKASAIIRQNLESLEVTEGFRILETDSAKAFDVFERDEVSFDVAFLDPPYEREDLYSRDLERFGSRPLLKADGRLVIEHSKRLQLADSVGSIRKFRSVVSGDSVLAFYRWEKA